jgi:hypothetical protein
MKHARAERPVSRLALAADHMLYGIVVAGRLVPESLVAGSRKRRGRR